jgi:solute carrier family 25 folate transporter 32
MTKDKEIGGQDEKLQRFSTLNKCEGKETPMIRTSLTAIQSIAAGVGAGLVSSLLCAPLDVAKVRIQVQGTVVGAMKQSGNLKETASPMFCSGGVWSSLRKIYFQEGIRGLYRGLGPTLITVPLFWGVYWPIYNSTKSHFMLPEYGELSPYLVHMLSAVVSGAIGDVITSPFWVARTRIQTLALHSNISELQSTGTLQMMRLMYANEGWKAFYKGLSASFLGLSHVAIQFPLCEFKTYICVLY